MKKVFAILLAGLMLAASAAAEELYTFAGVQWGTPIEECEAALEATTGVEFSPAVTTPYYYEFGWDYYQPDSDKPTIAAAPGEYRVLGIPIMATDTWPGICAYYTPADEDGTRTLKSIRIMSNRFELPEDPDTGRPDWSELQLAYEIFARVDGCYSGVTHMYMVGSDYDDGSTIYYEVPVVEYRRLFSCALDLSRLLDWEYFCIGMAQNNVNLFVDVTLPGHPDSWSDGDYVLTLEYLNCPFAETDFAQQLHELASPFPYADYPQGYIIIDP